MSSLHKKISFWLFITLFSIIKLNAQAPDTAWTRWYGGTGYDDGCSVQQTTDGGYIIVGYTESFGSSGEVYLIKTDSNGDTSWTRHYGRSGMDFGRCVQEIAGGNYIVAGVSENVNTTMSDVYIIKTDANGDTLWTKTYGAPLDEDWAESIQQTFDQGFIIGGWTYPYSTMNADFYLLRTNANGDTLWTKKYGGVYDDFCRSVSLTADSGYIFTGFTYSFGAGECDVYLLRTDENGDSVWTSTYGGTSFDAGASVKQTSDHGYIITGFTDSFGTAGDVYLIKINPELNILENTGANLRNKKPFLSVTPNPFRSKVNIMLHASDKQNITLRIYDALGRVVKTLSAKPNINITWNGSDNLKRQLNTGVYFIRFEYQNQFETEKILLITDFGITILTNRDSSGFWRSPQNDTPASHSERSEESESIYCCKRINAEICR